MLFALPRLPLLRRLSRRNKAVALTVVGGIFLAQLSVYAPTSGVSWCDRLSTCSCPPADVGWLQDDPRCATELQAAEDALVLGAAMTTETNVSVGNWWAGNVYSGALEKLGVITNDETSKCHVVNFRTLNNAWCILRKENIELRCLQLVQEKRAGRHAWTAIVKKGTYPVALGSGAVSEGSRPCGELTSLHHDIWTTLDAVKEKVTPAIPRHYAFVDVTAFSDDYLDRYCDETVSRYRTSKTAHSGRTYPDIFAAFIVRRHELLPAGHDGATPP